MIKHLLKPLSILALCLPLGASADYPLEVIELKGRTLEEILPMIRPFVEPGGAVSGMHNQLILRTSPANLREIRTLLERIDTPPQRLTITVRQRAAGAQEGTAIGAGADVRLRERARVQLGAPTPPDSVRLGGMRGSTERTSGHLSRVRTVSGSPAFISVGVSVPVTLYQRQADGIVRYTENAVRYRDATSGFYALPRVAGDQVTIDISPFRDQIGDSPGSFDISAATTRLNGRLGEWIPLGGSVERKAIQDSGGGISTDSERRRNTQIEIRVDAEP